MQIVFHLGVHCTDEERLLKCLLKNRGLLAAQGIAVPGPARYRALVRDTAVNLDGQAASPDTQALVLDQILEQGTADRLVLGWDSFLAFPLWALRGTLYSGAGERARALAKVFPDHGIEFHIGLRNPASFLPALLAMQRGRSYDEMMRGLHPQDLFWSDPVGDIVACNPDATVTVWCDEDTPLLWPDILQAVAGHAPDTVLEDTDDLLASILTPYGFRRMTHHLATRASGSPADRRRIVAAYLKRHALPDRMEMPVDLPGWSVALIEALTAQYDADLARIADLPGVRLIGL